jgi:hypothetical protein
MYYFNKIPQFYFVSHIKFSCFFYSVVKIVWETVQSALPKFKKYFSRNVLSTRTGIRP